MSETSVKPDQFVASDVEKARAAAAYITGLNRLLVESPIRADEIRVALDSIVRDPLIEKEIDEDGKKSPKLGALKKLYSRAAHLVTAADAGVTADPMRGMELRRQEQKITRAKEELAEAINELKTALEKNSDYKILQQMLGAVGAKISGQIRGRVSKELADYKAEYSALVAQIKEKIKEGEVSAETWPPSRSTASAKEPASESVEISIEWGDGAQKKEEEIDIEKQKEKFIKLVSDSAKKLERYWTSFVGVQDFRREFDKIVLDGRKAISQLKDTAGLEGAIKAFDEMVLRVDDEIKSKEAGLWQTNDSELVGAPNNVVEPSRASLSLQAVEAELLGKMREVLSERILRLKKELSDLIKNHSGNWEREAQLKSLLDRAQSNFKSLSKKESSENNNLSIASLQREIDDLNQRIKLAKQKSNNTKKIAALADELIDKKQQLKKLLKELADNSTRQ